MAGSWYDPSKYSKANPLASINTLSGIKMTAATPETINGADSFTPAQGAYITTSNGSVRYLSGDGAGGYTFTDNYNDPSGGGAKDQLGVTYKYDPATGTATPMSTQSYYAPSDWTSTYRPAAEMLGTVLGAGFGGAALLGAGGIGGGAAGAGIGAGEAATGAGVGAGLGGATAGASSADLAALYGAGGYGEGAAGLGAAGAAGGAGGAGAAGGLGGAGGLGAAGAGGTGVASAGTSGGGGLLSSLFGTGSGGLSNAYLANGLLGAASSLYASSQQANAAKDAAALQAQTAANNAALNAPWHQAGVNALGQIGANQDYFNHQFNANDLNANMAPNYAFQLAQGQQALDRQASTLGGQGGTGNFETGLQNYTQNTAAGAYQQAYNNYTNNQTNIYNRLASLAQLGQTANNSTIGSNTTLAGNQGQLGVAAGSYNAAGTIGAANAASGGLLGSSLFNYLNPTGTGAQTPQVAPASPITPFDAPG